MATINIMLLAATAITLSLQPTAHAWCDDGQDALKTHNDYRALHGAPPLTWDDTIAGSAQNWANYLGSKGCAVEHTQNGKYGQNLMSVASMVPMQNSCVDATKGWYNELYNPGYQFNSNPYSSQWDYKMIGHFTAVVWKATQRMGCGASWGQGTNGWTLCYIQVCEYDPPGNMVGDVNFIANVLPLGTPLPSGTSAPQPSSQPTPSPDPSPSLTPTPDPTPSPDNNNNNGNSNNNGYNSGNQPSPPPPPPPPYKRRSALSKGSSRRALRA